MEQKINKNKTTENIFNPQKMIDAYQI